MTYVVRCIRHKRSSQLRFVFEDFIVAQQFARAFTQCRQCRGVSVLRIKDHGAEELIWRLEGDSLGQTPAHIPFDPVSSP